MNLRAVLPSGVGGIVLEIAEDNFVHLIVSGLRLFNLEVRLELLALSLGVAVAEVVLIVVLVEFAHRQVVPRNTDPIFTTVGVIAVAALAVPFEDFVWRATRLYFLEKCERVLFADSTDMQIARISLGVGLFLILRFLHSHRFRLEVTASSILSRQRAINLQMLILLAC